MRDVIWDITKFKLPVRWKENFKQNHHDLISNIYISSAAHRCAHGGPKRRFPSGHIFPRLWCRGARARTRLALKLRESEIITGSSAQVKLRADAHFASATFHGPLGIIISCQSTMVLQMNEVGAHCAQSVRSPSPHPLALCLALRVNPLKQMLFYNLLCRYCRNANDCFPT